MDGRLREALVLLDEVRTLLPNVTRRNEVRVTPGVVEGYMAAGRQQDALLIVGQALEQARARTERGSEARALYLLAELASRVQVLDVQQTAEDYRKAQTLADDLGMRPLVAHCHLGLAKLYRRTGRRQEVQEHLTTATTMYREMDMTYWLDQAVAEG
jgi:hypothetical protein